MPGSSDPLEVGIQIPHHFRCPISLELMHDPVTVCTGQTYDRHSIESWLSTGNTTCPVTRTQLTDFTFIPNHTLRRLIQQWSVSNRAFGVERVPTPKQLAEPGLIRSLLSQASLNSNHLNSRLSAVKKLRQLARDSDKNRSMISASNASKTLLSIVFARMDSDSSELTHESLAILSMLSLTENECDYIASDSERVSYLVSMLFHGCIDVRVNSAVLIEIVIAGTRSQEHRAQVSNTDDIFEGIIGILNYPLAYPRAVKVGINALFALCLARQHRYKAVNGGAVEVVIEKLTDLEKCDAEIALAIIDLLSRIPSGCLALAAHALTVPLLVKSMLKVSERATEYAAGALLAVCSESEKAQRDSVAAGVLTRLLMLVQSDCTERAKRKAQMMLKLLRDCWLEDCIANSDDYAYDYVCSDVALF